MRETRIASRYAKALFDLSLEQNTLEEVSEDMSLVYQVAMENKDLLLLLKNPIVNKPKKIEILTQIFASKVNDLSMRFLALITKKGREIFIKEISHQFKILYNKHHNIIEAVVILPTGDDSIVNELKRLLTNYTNSNISISSKVDPSLIGGFILNFADNQYDTSLRKRIHQLRTQFSDNLYMNKYR